MSSARPLVTESAPVPLAPGQLSLDDFLRTHTRPHDPVTSRRAAARVAAPPLLTELQHRILRRIYEYGDAGVTHEQLLIDFAHTDAPLADSTVRTRVSELVKLGYVRDSGRTKLNARGHSCVLWQYVTGIDL